MSGEQPSNTHGRTRLSFASVADIDEFVATLEKYERGDLTPDEWRAFRLVRGTYGQRQTGDFQMLRIKVPQGILTSEQLNALAEVGEKYSRRFGHITTRQNIQFHFVKLHDAELAMRRLEQAGLTTREACGNSVRNITACPYAGTAKDEPFDVTPYADAVTRFLLRHRLSSTLPRKFKIAFEGCREDHIGAAINDLAFFAELGPGGERGFRVFAGGGTAIMCKNGGLIHDFLPAGEVFRAAEAVLRVFKRLGDYKHKQRNRMKFLIKALGWDVWLQKYEAELAECRAADGVPLLTIDPPVETQPAWEKTEAPTPSLISARVSAVASLGPGITPTIVPVFMPGDEAYVRWRATNVRAQKQFGYVTVTATVPLGDLTSEQMRVLGELSQAYGDGTVRVTPDQDLMFRWVTIADVRELYRRLSAAGLGLAEASTIANVASCPGAESCRLAVTQSRGLGRLLEDYLRGKPESDRRRRRCTHQDQRLPQRLRAASHRDHRLPGERAPAGRTRRAAVLRHGWGRHDRGGRELRADGGENSRTPDSGDDRSPARVLPARADRRRIGAVVLPAGAARSRERGARGPAAARRGRREAGRFHRSCRDRSVRARSHGRGVLGLTEIGERVNW